MKYGILSTSSIAPRFIEAVRAAQTGEVYALSSRTVEKAQEKAEQWGIATYYGDHAQLLQDPAVDIVYISTVNAQHYPWAKAALEHGKHVVCEKPCTLSAEQTSELYALARKNGLFLMEAQKMLFLPAILETKRRILAGELGTIRMAEFTHSFDGSYNTWMYDDAAGGGPLWSSAIYVVELLLHFFGSIRRCSGVPTRTANGVESQYVLMGQTESGVLFSAKNSTVAPLKNGCVIYGERGYVELPDYWKARKAVFHRNDGTEEVVEYPCTHELMYEAEHIAQCFEKGLLESPVVTEKLSVDAISVLENIKATW